MNKMIKDVLGHSRELHDQLRAWYVRVLYLGSMGRPQDAVKDGIYVLSQLGETIRPRSKLWVAIECLKINRELRSISDGMILRLPRMTDPDRLAAMQMYNMVYVYALFSQSRLYPLIVLRMVRLSLRYGLCEVSCFAFAMYGMMVIAVASDIDFCCRLSSLGLQMLHKFQARSYLPEYTSLTTARLVHGENSPESAYRVFLKLIELE